MNHAPQKLANAEAALETAQEDLKTLQWQQQNADNPDFLAEAVTKQQRVVERKQATVGDYQHEFDVAVTTSYATSKAALRQDDEANDPEKRARIQDDIDRLEAKRAAHARKIAEHQAEIARLKAKGQHTVDERAKHQRAIDRLEEKGDLSRKEYLELHALQKELKSTNGLPPEEREKHKRIVARGDELKAEGSWDALRRERHVRFHLAKYKKAVEHSALSVEEIDRFYANDRLLVDALELLPTYPYNKTGGGRNLNEAEQEALNLAKTRIAAGNSPDYLASEAPGATRELSRPSTGGHARKTSSTVSRELPKPNLKGNAPAPTKQVGGTRELTAPALTGSASRKVPALPPLPSRPVLKGTAPVAKDHKVAATRELERPLKDETYVAPPPRVAEEPKVVAPTVAAPKPPAPVLSPRPQELQERPVFDPEPQPRRNIVNRILGKRG